MCLFEKYIDLSKCESRCITKLNFRKFVLCHSFKEFSLIHHMTASAEGAQPERAVRKGRHRMFI